jgi:cell division protein FtsB
MTFKQLNNNKFFRFASNRYILLLLVFIVWIGFFDENSYLVHYKLFDREIKQLEADKDYYQTQIEIDSKKIEKLEDPERLDQFAREKYKMKKQNEEIFIIEYDTLKQK